MSLEERKLVGVERALLGKENQTGLPRMGTEQQEPMEAMQ